MKCQLSALALALACAVLTPDASAFCVYNDLKDRAVKVTQEEHPDWKRQESRFQKTLAAGTNACCEFKNLDCNPNGRQNSLVGFEVVVVEGDTALKCGPVGVPEKQRVVKVVGDGTLRIVPNPRHDPKKDSARALYIARVWAHDRKDITGPTGLPCR